MPRPTPRYIYRLGIVVADDVVERGSDNARLPLEGALVVRLKKPVLCVFISFGLGGICLPGDTGGLCVIGDGWNGIAKEERLALSNMMHALDFENRLALRASWVLIDMKETEARVLRSPTDAELLGLAKRFADMRSDDRARYRTVARIARRRTTAGALAPDDHEDDSDKDPLMVYLQDLSKREEKAEAARKKRLGGFPDTPFGRKMARMYPRGRPPSKTAGGYRPGGSGPGADRSRGLTTGRWNMAVSRPGHRSRSGLILYQGETTDGGDSGNAEEEEEEEEEKERAGITPPVACPIPPTPSHRQTPAPSPPPRSRRPAPPDRAPEDLPTPAPSASRLPLDDDGNLDLFGSGDDKGM
jgi:hypothetical protein